MKKTLIIISGLFLFFGIVPHVLAQGFVPLATIPGLTDIQPTPGGLAVFFNNLYKYIIGIAAVLAVIMIIWGGLEYSTQDSVSKKSDGKERILQAIFGLILVLSPVLVFSIINPSILNLSLNLPELKTVPGSTTGPGGGSGTGTGTAVTDPATLCSVTGVAGFLRQATCPSDSSASQWMSSANCWRSALACLLQNSSGCTQKVVTCESQSAPIVFVDVGESGSFSYILQPINAAAASTFQQFKSGCDSSGGALCTVGLKTAGSSNCNNFGGYTTNISGEVAGKCYNTPVMCFSQADASSATSYIHLNPFNTSSYYSCVPDVQFNPQPIQ